MFNDQANCSWRGDEQKICHRASLYTPVLIFVAKGFKETARTRVPVTMPTIGCCSGCRDAMGSDLAKEIAPEIAARIGPAFAHAGLDDLEFVRVEWATTTVV